MFFAVRDEEALQSVKTRPGADSGSDHELLIAKFRLKLKKVWKTTRPFRYDLNQIPYDYTVEVTNRFKELDLVDIVPGKLWTEVCTTAQEAKISQRKRNTRRQSGCLEEALKIAEERSKRQERKGKI